MLFEKSERMVYTPLSQLPPVRHICRAVALTRGNITVIRGAAGRAQLAQHILHCCSEGSRLFGVYETEKTSVLQVPEEPLRSHDELVTLFAGKGIVMIQSSGNFAAMDPLLFQLKKAAQITGSAVLVSKICRGQDLDTYAATDTEFDLSQQGNLHRIRCVKHRDGERIPDIRYSVDSGQFNLHI